MEEEKGKDLKRKAESPRLVLEISAKKKAKLLPITKSLEGLIRNHQTADHIQYQFSQDRPIVTDFIKASDETKPDEEINLPSFPPLHKRELLRGQSKPNERVKLSLSHFLDKKELLSNPDHNDGAIRRKLELCEHFPSVKFKQIESEKLDLQYVVLFPSKSAEIVMSRLEKEIKYQDEKQSRIRIFGRFFNIPRKQAAFGDAGLTYTFSGRTVKGLGWTPLMKELLDIVNSVTHANFNFVLVNRYKDGRDHIGEHKDNEEDLDPTAPIASLSFGAARKFLLRHQDLRKKKSVCTISPVTLNLENGSLLVMNPPTNNYWYHSLPRQNGCLFPRVNLTFRRMIVKKKK